MLDLVIDQIYKTNWIQPNEYISLVSTFWAINDKEYNCSFCKKKFSQSVRDTRKACSVIRDKPVLSYGEMSYEIKYYKCPTNFYNPALAMLIDNFRHFRNGVLPYQGGLMDQPCKIVDIYNLVESLTNELANDQKEKANKWQKAQSRSNSRSMSKKL